MNTVKFLKDVINAEKKFYDVSGTANLGTSGSMVSLDTLTQGAGGSSRNGNSIKASSIQLRATCNINGSATDTFVRFILFIDKDGPEAGSAPAPGDLLTAATPTAALNMSYANRFRVISDRVISLSVNGRQAISLNIYRRLNHHIKWDTSGSSAVGNYESGHIWLLMLSDQATLTAPTTYTSRLRYYDN